jgi:DNA polymerase III delta subunit
MIYLFLGQYKKASQKAAQLVDVLIKKQPDASVLKFNVENFDVQSLADLIVTQGLFFNKNIIVLSKVFDDSDSKEMLIKNLAGIKDSQNIFIFIEESLDKKSFEKFEKFAEKIQEIKSDEKKVTTEFNMFSLTDALGRRDKKNLWLLYRDALKNGAAEEVYGILWWQLKTLLIVRKNETAAESGLKPFVFSKAKDFLRNFKDDEIEKKAFDLVKIYHNSRRQSSELEISLEKWILSF